MIRNLGIFLLPFVLAVPLFAVSLSLSDCLKRAQQKSPQVVEGILNESKAKGAFLEARSQKAPHLLGVGAYDKSDDPSKQLPDANKAVLRAEQTVYPLGSDWIRGHQREAEYRAATFSKIESEQDVALLVKQLYFAILRDSNSVGSFRDVESELKRLQQTILPKYSIGRVPPFDLVKVKSAIADLQRADSLTQAQLVGEKKQLAQIVGEDDVSLEPIQSIPAIPDESVITNPSSNPTLQSLTEQSRASEFGVRAARAGRRPELTAGFEYGYAGQTSATTSLGWDVSAGLKLSLFNWGRTSFQIDQEKASAGFAQNKLQREQQSVNVELVQTKATANAHLSDFRTLKDLLPQAHEAATVAVRRYRQGATGILEVSDAINLWLQSLINERAAYYAYLSDLAKIERLVGRNWVHYGEK